MFLHLFPVGECLFEIGIAKKSLEKAKIIKEKMRDLNTKDQKLLYDKEQQKTER